MKLFPALAALILLMLATTTIAQPLDDIVERRIIKDRQVLAYPPLREADIFWEKRVWRVIDVREKMNQTFVYPKGPLFTVLRDAAIDEDITLYSTENDNFSIPLDAAGVRGLFFHRDTVERVDPVTYEIEQVIIENEVNFEDVKRFRIKETWFFDENYGTLRVRILGIAPMIDVTDEHGNFRFEKPMFWVYYSECREVFARQTVFNPRNDTSPVSWEDLFEMRYFASHIYKESNVNDLQLRHYYSGVDRLLEAEKIKQEIFNFEHDLWSY